MRLRIFVCHLLVLSVFSGLVWAQAVDDIALHRHCENCGMDRKSYGYSRVLLRYADGVEVGSCSLSCAIMDMKKREGSPVLELLVADRDTLTLIDSKTAHWVVGGSKRGVMTVRPKWAFAAKEAAEEFVRKFGGTAVAWETVLIAAREDAASAGPSK
jgi:copper chaperone NosL